MCSPSHTGSQSPSVTAVLVRSPLARELGHLSLFSQIHKEESEKEAGRERREGKEEKEG